MSLGEIPGGNLRGYWKLENTNDSSGNGYNLTNNNSVSFNKARFSSGADFGTSGTNKGLTTTSYILSSVYPTYLYYSFWFKLNNSSSSNANAQLFHLITTTTSGGGGVLISNFYNISAGNLNISCRFGGGASNQVLTMPADTNWHYFVGLLSSAGGSMNYSVDRNPSYQANCTFATFSGATVGFRIGNTNALTTQAWATIDEVIISESVYTQQNTVIGLSQRVKYYTQARGMFI